MKKGDKQNKNLSPWLIIVPIISFVIGAMIFAYPAVSNYLVEINQKEIISGYDESIIALNEANLAKEWEEAYKYNENLKGEPVHDPFVYGSGYAVPDNYEEVLNTNKDGVMGHVVIPKIAVDLPIYHGTEDEVLLKASGHIEGSALPIGAKGLISFISAHRGLPSATLFTHLDKLENGDKFYIKVLDKMIVYQVYKVETIKPEDIQYVANDPNKEIVVLLTCTPYGVNTHRLLVYGEKVDIIDDKQEIIQEVEVIKEPSWILNYAFAIALGLIIIIIILLIYKMNINKYRRNK